MLEQKLTSKLILRSAIPPLKNTIPTIPARRRGQSRFQSSEARRQLRPAAVPGSTTNVLADETAVASANETETVTNSQTTRNYEIDKTVRYV